MLFRSAGTIVDWEATSEERWNELCTSLGESAASHGVGTLRLLPRSGPSTSALAMRRVAVGPVAVVVDPRIDGRRRILDALARMGGDITEESLGAALHEGAGEVDLVVVADAEHVLPSAVVWELAYAELVFVAAGWGDLSGDVLDRGVGEFARRHRRFGGVDE